MLNEDIGMISYTLSKDFTFWAQLYTQNEDMGNYNF